jgi:hypothetical protein
LVYSAGFAQVCINDARLPVDLHGPCAAEADP